MFQNDKLSILPGVFYRNRYNGFTSVTQALNDSTLLTTRQNLATSQSSGVEVVISGKLWEIISLNLSTNAYYEEIDASNLGFSNRKSTTSWSGSLNANFNVSKGTILQVNSNYRSARLTPQGKIAPNYVVNMGARQDLFDDKLSIIFTVSDIFRTLNSSTDLHTDWLSQNSVSSRDSRVVYLGLTYHLGGFTKNSKDKALQYDESN
jgi:hypothetical protein